MLKKLFLSAVLCTASMVAMAQSQIITHVVQRGETLESIAKYYNISVADLNNANPNADGIYLCWNETGCAGGNNHRLYYFFNYYHPSNDCAGFITPR